MAIVSFLADLRPKQSPFILFILAGPPLLYGNLAPMKIPLINNACSFKLMIFIGFLVCNKWNYNSHRKGIVSVIRMFHSYGPVPVPWSPYK